LIKLNPARKKKTAKKTIKTIKNSTPNKK